MMLCLHNNTMCSTKQSHATQHKTHTRCTAQYAQNTDTMHSAKHTHCTAQHAQNTTQHNTTQRNATQHSTTQHISHISQYSACTAGGSHATARLQLQHAFSQPFVFRHELQELCVRRVIVDARHSLDLLCSVSKPQRTRWTSKKIVWVTMRMGMGTRVTGGGGEREWVIVGDSG